MTPAATILVSVVFFLWAVSALSLCGVMIWVTWFADKPTPKE